MAVLAYQPRWVFRQLDVDQTRLVWSKGLALTFAVLVFLHLHAFKKRVR